MDSDMRVLHVCTEIYPLLKTGGLADVLAGLTPAQIRLGADVRLLVPAFPAFREKIEDQQLVAELGPHFGSAAARLHIGRLPDGGAHVYLIDAPEFYGRPGNPYSDTANHAYSDNDRRFALLGWAGAQLAAGCDPYWRPQVVHGHDWHAGLMPAYLKAAEHASGQRLAGSVLTIHNLAYQGVFPAYTFGELGLPGSFYDINGLEFHGNLSFLKAGLYFADKLTTVSPTYAREIQQPEQGCGFEGLLSTRGHDLEGILNGVDPEVWNPAIDASIASTYSLDAMAGKAACKAALQRETGLKEDPDALVFSVVSRLTEQKGLNLVLEALPDILRRGGQLVLLGSGDPWMESAFRDAAHNHPESVSVHIGYDEAKSHRVIAGADVILVPSRFEPCGLTQLYGLIYGTLPLVRKVGGLADTVADASLENLAEGLATGFVFDAFELDGFVAAIRRAFALYGRRNDWQEVQQRGMRQKFEWDIAAARYLELYRHIAV
jgi:starch synthase